MNSESEIQIYSVNSSVISQQCRVCLAENIEQSECVFDKRESSTIASMLMLCARVQVACQDGLPDVICARCLGDLEVANSFRLRCELSDSLLRKFYCDGSNVQKPGKVRQTQSPVKEEVNIVDCTEYGSEDYVDSDGDSVQFVDATPGKFTQIQSDVITNASNQATKSRVNELPCKLMRSDEKACSGVQEPGQVKQEELGEDCIKPESIIDLDSDTEQDQAFSILSGEPILVQSDVISDSCYQETKKSCHGIPSNDLLARNKDKSSNLNIQHNARNIFSCTLCSFISPLRREMISHIRTHVRKQPFSCNLCRLPCQSLSKLKAHRTMCTLKNSQTCDFCQAIYVNSTYFKVHKIICEKKKPEDQPVTEATLDDSASSSSDTSGHLFHKSQVFKSHQCNHCSIRFFSLKNLSRHKKLKHLSEDGQSEKAYESNNTRHEVLQYTCEKCGKQLSSSRTLEIHIKRHLNIRDFACEVCGRTFVDKSEKVMHARLHTDSKKLLCDICGFKSRTKQNLISHLLTHREVKNFKCEICPYKCHGKYKLKLHMRSHSDVRLFSCPKCDAKFKRNSHINRHMQRIHKLHYKVGDHSDRRFIK